jgi:hypothetical protein
MENGKFREYNQIKSRHFFCKERYKNLQNYLLDFLSYQDIIKISVINKSLFYLARNRINTHEIKVINKKYFPPNDEIFLSKEDTKTLSLKNYDMKLKKILNEEVDISTKTILRHVCFYIQKTFRENIRIQFPDDVGLCSDSLEYLREFDLDPKIKHIEIEDFLFAHDENISRLIKNIIQPRKFSSQIITINLSENLINDELLEMLQDFITKSTCIENVNLNNTMIGDTEQSLKFLDSLNCVKTLKNLKLNTNDYDSDCIEILKKFLNKEDNFFNLSMCENNLSLEEIKSLLVNFRKEPKRTFSLSAKHVFNHYEGLLQIESSPIYYINSRLGIEYNSSFGQNFDFYIEGLDLEELTISRGTYSRDDLINLLKIINLPKLKSVYFDFRGKIIIIEN